MPNPKHKHSKSRRDKRRTHYKATAPTLAIDAATGEAHLWHRAINVQRKNDYGAWRLIAILYFHTLFTLTLQLEMH